MVTKTIAIRGMDDQEDADKVSHALHEVWGINKRRRSVWPEKKRCLRMTKLQLLSAIFTKLFSISDLK